MQNTPDKPMRRLFQFLRDYRSSFLAGCSSSIVNKIFDLMPPLLVGWVIDSVRGENPLSPYFCGAAHASAT